MDILNMVHRESSLTVEGEGAVINHLYWTAASTLEDSDVMEAKWWIMLRDIHKRGTPAFPCCAHPHLVGEASVVATENLLRLVRVS